MSIEYKQIEDGELLKWPDEKAGKITIEGVLRTYKTQPDTGKGVGHVYEVETRDGMVPFFAPSLLHKKLQNIPMDSVVNIKFTKVTKTAIGNPLKHFDVGHAPGTTENLKAVGVEVFENVEDDEINPDEIPH